MADTPYSLTDRYCLNEQLRELPVIDPTSAVGPHFVMHLGDIKSGRSSCEEWDYTDVRDIVVNAKNSVSYDPSAWFWVVGDNEWIDCPNVAEDVAFGWWKKYFVPDHPESESVFGSHPALNVRRQNNREDNFAFYLNNVLFVGVSLIGGSVLTADIDDRLEDNRDWVTNNLADFSDTIKAMVVFGHASLVGSSSRRSEFGDYFKTLVATQYPSLPVLYMYGDGHSYSKTVDAESGMLIVRADDGNESRPLRVNVQTGVDGVTGFVIDDRGGSYGDSTCPLNPANEEVTWGNN